jgi:alkanesulfonate monooxygenase SsuD/methylene tetrahydromethanopterin reductase-like flavin-dependent oxidoreductase (luciferase family)
MFDTDSVIAGLQGAHQAHQDDKADRKAHALPKLPKVGTIDAKAFMLAMRNAGQRKNDKGRTFTDQSKIRADQIQAIAAYIGYDHTKNFGPQEQIARDQAKRELTNRPDHGLSRQEQREVARSLHGFVAGTPDMMAKKLADLRARETFLTESMIDAKKKGETAEAQRLYALLGNTRDEIDRLA